MTGKWKRGNAVPLSDLATDILDPLMRRRAGISLGLVQSWEEIVGERLARMSRPEKIAWPRRLSEDDPFQPATLVVACQGAAAIHLQHETTEIIERANAFLGFAAIGRVRIVQKPVAVAQARPRIPMRPVTPEETTRLRTVTSGIENEDLRHSLERLGRSVIGSQNKPKASPIR